MANLEEVLIEVEKLLDAFPEFKPPNPEGTIKVYAQILKDVPAESLTLAVNEWMATERWFPKAADLLLRSRGGDKKSHFIETRPRLVGIFSIRPEGWAPLVEHDGAFFWALSDGNSTRRAETTREDFKRGKHGE